MHRRIISSLGEDTASMFRLLIGGLSIRRAAPPFGHALPGSSPHFRNKEHHEKT
jgi:hypothetical protein